MNANQVWGNRLEAAWFHAYHGHFNLARSIWAEADEIAALYDDEWGEIRLNPDLQLLRWLPGTGEGIVRQPIPGEDLVIGIQFQDWPPEHDDERGLKKLPMITGKAFRQYQLKSDFARQNIHKELPHLMVLSTGRCGTIGLAHLLGEVGYLSYHTFAYNVAPATKYFLMTKLATGAFQADLAAEEMWAGTRKAEWISAENVNKPIAMSCHLDTVFAPVFAQIHPASKFIYLHRDPVSIFESFYTKNQWNPDQLHPILFNEYPWCWRRQAMSLPEYIAWYIKFTERFSRAFGKVMKSRFLEVSADRLFERDASEMDSLLTFLDTDREVSLEDIDRFYATPYNVKAHKATNTEHLEEAREAFLKAYETMR